MKDSKQLASEHWDWVEQLITPFIEKQDVHLVTIEYLYKTAFIHGYKHGKEDREDENP